MSKLLLLGHKIFFSLILLLVPLFILLANADEPKKLATFDYAIADTLVALQYLPLALAGLAPYRRFYQEPLLFETLELGGRFQPNLEYLASLDPDAILISPPAHLNLEGTLSRIAGVIKIQLFEKDRDLWQSLKHLTIRMGELNAAQKQAQEFIDSVEARLTVIAVQIKRPAEPLLIVEIRDDRHVRLYGAGSLEDIVLTKLGLENAWEGSTNDWGFSTLTIPEAFQLEGKIVLLHPAYSDSTLPTSGLWQHWLDDTSVSINRNYWPWGGFSSALRFAEALVEALETPTEP